MKKEKNISQKIKESMESKLKKWLVCQTPPRWYKYNFRTKEIYVDDFEAPLIKLAFELRFQWYSYNEISEELFERWLKSKTNKLMWHSTIQWIIKNKFYIWKMIFAWKEYEWKYPTFISDDLWIKANSENEKDCWINVIDYDW